MEKVKINICGHDFPKQIQKLFEGTTVYDTGCHSGATVLYLDSGYYVKIDEKGKLRREVEMVQWFDRMKMGAELVTFISEEKDYMVTKAVKGEDATHWLKDPEHLCEVLAKTMRRLHDLPPESVPVSPCMDIYEQMRKNPSEDSEKIETVIRKMRSNTLIHGDFCLPNVMMQDWQFQAFIDVGLAGIGDRHIDIFWALWSLEYNLKTDQYRDQFLNLYGRDRVDMDVLALVESVELRDE